VLHGGRGEVGAACPPMVFDGLLKKIAVPEADDDERKR